MGQKGFLKNCVIFTKIVSCEKTYPEPDYLAQCILRLCRCDIRGNEPHGARSTLCFFGYLF